jgi:hypothetical protein
MACECGAFKVHKAAHSAREHSDWCPWSKFYSEWLAKRGGPDISCCNSWTVDEYTSDREWCKKPGERWVIYSQQSNTKYYFCKNCFDACFGAGELANILDWGKVT